MRIISGCCRGRKLTQLRGRAIRPTSDRTREAVFNIIGTRVRNARILDLFAGTGALGIEALSRGASHATFIDRDCDVIRQNLSRCNLAGLAEIITMDLTSDKFLPALFSRPFDIVFIDPPYGKGLIEHIVRKTFFTDLLSENAIIIAEHSDKEKIEIPPPGLDILKQKKYSKTKISILTP